MSRRDEYHYWMMLWLQSHSPSEREVADARRVGRENLRAHRTTTRLRVVGSRTRRSEAGGARARRRSARAVGGGGGGLIR